jgi:hypothetical protein
MIVGPYLDVIVVSDSAFHFDTAMAGFSGIIVLVSLRLALRRSGWLQNVCRSHTALWIASDWIKANDSKGTQTYTYSESTGLLTELVDSSHEGMKFTATYDVEGTMLTEGYPNGMTAPYAYNLLGVLVSLEDEKVTHSSEKCTWFSDTGVPPLHGQWLDSRTRCAIRSTYYTTWSGGCLMCRARRSGKAAHDARLRL